MTECEKGVFIIKLKGTEILMKILHEEGVDTIFGFPGGAVLDIFDELFRSDVNHIVEAIGKVRANSAELAKAASI